MDEKLKAILQTLFGDDALTLEQLESKLSEKAEEIQIVNIVGGDYVPKSDLDTKIKELGTAAQTIKDLQETAKQFDGKDPQKLADDLSTLQAKYDTDTANIRRDAAIDLALVKAKAHDAIAVRPYLNMDDIKVDEKGMVTGIDGQIEAIQKEKAWLFAAEDSDNGQPPYNPPKGGTPAAGADDMGSALAAHYNV